MKYNKMLILVIGIIYSGIVQSVLSVNIISATYGDDSCWPAFQDVMPKLISHCNIPASSCVFTVSNHILLEDDQWDPKKGYPKTLTILFNCMGHDDVSNDSITVDVPEYSTLTIRCARTESHGIKPSHEITPGNPTFFQSLGMGKKVLGIGAVGIGCLYTVATYFSSDPSTSTAKTEPIG